MVDVHPIADAVRVEIQPLQFPCFQLFHHIHEAAHVAVPGIGAVVIAIRNENFAVLPTHLYGIQERRERGVQIVLIHIIALAVQFIPKVIQIAA